MIKHDQNINEESMHSRNLSDLIKSESKNDESEGMIGSSMMHNMNMEMINQ